MCKRREEIDAKIAYYKQLLASVNDRTAIALLNIVIADLESDKIALSPRTSKVASVSEPNRPSLSYPTMERAIVMQRLAQAERHAAEGEQHIARQRELVAEMVRDGHDTELAQMLLIRFEEVQALHISDRDRLRAELAELK